LILHAYGWGSHAIALSADVTNTTEYTTKHHWRDEFGVAHARTYQPGQEMVVEHWVRFEHQESYEDGFFEKIMFRLYAEFSAHEVFEQFLVHGRRLYNPHDMRQFVMPGTYQLVHSTWRNYILWDSIQQAMRPGPKTTIISRYLMFERKLWSAKSYVHTWRARMKKPDMLERIRLTCVLINNITYEFFQKSLLPTQWLEEKLMQRRAYMKKIEEKMAAEEAKEAA
jgi:hypothetical protein